MRSRDHKPIFPYTISILSVYLQIITMLAGEGVQKMASEEETHTPSTQEPTKRCGFEFIREVSEEYKCKVCGSVATGIVLLGCCGEHSCEACISPFQEDGRPCPCCGEREVTWLPHKRHRKSILSLEVLCSMQKRGCEWTGVLRDLEAHLDPNSGDCQFVNVQCPNKCSELVPKRHVPYHLANCPKRDYNCRYCGFSSTYQAVCEEHYSTCDSYPISCPNDCAVGCIEQGTLELHLSTCPRQEVECEFSYAGCTEMVQREFLEKHKSEKTQHHISLLSAMTLKFFKKVEEKDEEIREMRMQLAAVTRDIKGVKMKTDMKLKNLSGVTADQKIRLATCEAENNKLSKRLDVCETATLSHSFLLPNIREECTKTAEWFSPPMFTHPGGYKFCINVNLDGASGSPSGSVDIYICQLKGEFDDRLFFPANVTFTLTLHNNKCTGNWFNVEKTHTHHFEKQSVAMSTPNCISEGFVRTSVMFNHYACCECLFFSVSNISVTYF